MTATRIEFQAVAHALQLTSPVSQYGIRALESDEGGLYVLLIQSGIGPEKARKSTQQLFKKASWDGIISTGFAGDLEKDCIGSVLVGHEVFFDQSTAPPTSSPSRMILCHPDWVKTAMNIDWMGRKSLRSGRFVSVNRVLNRSVDKQTMRTSTGAVGVDMESGVIGEVAQKHGVPFLIVRSISDGAHEDLPIDFNLFLRPSGWLTGMMHIITTPKSWKDFLKLYQHSKEASWQLTNFFEEFFSALSKISSPSSLVSGKS